MRSLSLTLFLNEERGGRKKVSLVCMLLSKKDLQRETRIWMSRDVDVVVVVVVAVGFAKQKRF